MFTARKDRRTSGIVSDIYHHTVSVLRGQRLRARLALRPGRLRHQYWPLELYKLTGAAGRELLAIALVTGGASGIGRAVALRLAAEGAHVVVTDLDAAGASKVADEVTAASGAGRAVGVGMDVAREDSVRAAFEEAVLAYGGIDIVVSNAGIAHSTPIDQLTLSDWERSFSVNSTGHFLVAREGLRLMKAQGLGGAFVFVATKNVMSPGKDFAAYSASKAAEAQLAKVLALEAGPYGIRSNLVNPDAVFRDSRLWTEEIRRERARAQGIAVGTRGLHRKQYLAASSRKDVAEAVLLRVRPLGQDHHCTITVTAASRTPSPLSDERAHLLRWRPRAAQRTEVRSRLPRRRLAAHAF